MRLRTDDDIYRARLVYLGPPGYALPWQIPYSQYGVIVVMTLLFWLLRFLLTWHVTLVPIWELCAATIATSLIYRFVDPDRPARKLIATLLSDWHRVTEPLEDRRLPTLTGRRVVIRAGITGPRAARR